MVQLASVLGTVYRLERLRNPTSLGIKLILGAVGLVLLWWIYLAIPQARSGHLNLSRNLLLGVVGLSALQAFTTQRRLISATKLRQYPLTNVQLLAISLTVAGSNDLYRVLSGALLVSALPLAFSPAGGLAFATGVALESATLLWAASISLWRGWAVLRLFLLGLLLVCFWLALNVVEMKRGELFLTFSICLLATVAGAGLFWRAYRAQLIAQPRPSATTWRPLRVRIGGHYGVLLTKEVGSLGRSLDVYLGILLSLVAAVSNLFQDWLTANKALVVVCVVLATYVTVLLYPFGADLRGGLDRYRLFPESAMRLLTVKFWAAAVIAGAGIAPVLLVILMHGHVAAAFLCAAGAAAGLLLYTACGRWTALSTASLSVQSGEFKFNSGGSMTQALSAVALSSAGPLALILTNMYWPKWAFVGSAVVLSVAALIAVGSERIAGRGLSNLNPYLLNRGECVNC